MAFTVHDIQTIHSFKKNVRDPKIPQTIRNSIETIHKCISHGLNASKKVDWRESGNGRDKYSQNQAYVANTFGARLKANTTNVPANYKPEDARPSKYVSKFKKTSEKVDDTILNTILRGKLNKFSQSNYIEIKEFITHIIDGGQTDMIKCFMKLVFEKAASEEIFCPLYAKLLSELSTQYPVLLTEMGNLYTQYMEIFEEVNETTEETYNEMCKRNIEKKYRRGYSQFLAELIKHNVIDMDIFMKIIMKIIGQVEITALDKECIKLNEEFADCLMKIMKAIQYDSQSKTITNIRLVLKGDVSNRIQVLSVRNNDMFGLSNKSRFTFLDLYEAIQKF